MIDNKIKYGISKRIQTISQVIIIIIVIALLFIIQGMLSGLETKTLSSYTKAYENIVLDSGTDFSGKHYPYTLNRNKVYELLVDKNMNPGALREIRYIAEDQKPYTTVETKVTKQFYRSSKCPLTNIAQAMIARQIDNELDNSTMNWYEMTLENKSDNLDRWDKKSQKNSYICFVY